MSEYDVLCSNVSDACNINAEGKHCPHKYPHQYHREECGGTYCSVTHKWGECRKLWMPTPFAKKKGIV